MLMYLPCLGFGLVGKGEEDERTRIGLEAGQRKGRGLMRATACLLPLLAVGTGIHAVWTRSYQCSPDKSEWTSGGPTHMNDDGDGSGSLGSG